jgi:hypothetical protein
MKTHGDTGELTACGDRPCWVLDRSLIGTGLTNPIVSAVDHHNPHLAVWNTLQALEWGIDYVFACAAGDQHLQLTDPRTNACGSRAATALPTKRECGCSQQFASNAPSLRVVLTATGLLKLLRPEYGGLNVPAAYAAALAAHPTRFAAGAAEHVAFGAAAAEAQGSKNKVPRKRAAMSLLARGIVGVQERPE